MRQMDAKPSLKTTTLDVTAGTTKTATTCMIVPSDAEPRIMGCRELMAVVSRAGMHGSLSDTNPTAFTTGFEQAH